MSIFNTIFRKTASRSQNKDVRSGRDMHRSHKTSLRTQESLMDRVGSFEVSE